MRIHPSIPLVLLALLYTGLNALKPLHMDDGAYHAYAAQIARAPLDPYGFEIGPGMPANHTLAPPVLPYWVAAGFRLVGDHLVWSKLWLFPLVLVFVLSLHALFRRFAPGMETPLLWLTVLSPTFLPSLNLMLDVPAVALSLGALVLFFRACDRSSVAGAVLAGVTAGLAMETKYTAFAAPVVMLWYAILFRKVPLALLAAALAGVIFVGWESWIAARYGESHFLYSLHERDGLFWERVGRLVLPLVGILGGVAPVVGLLGLAGLGLSRRAVMAMAGVIVLGYLLVAVVPDTWATFYRSPQSGKEQLNLNNVVFGVLGISVSGAAVAVARRLRQLSGDDPNGSATGRTEWFLFGWLALEVAGYFVLSPFPAVRRVMGVVVVGTVLAGRLASRTCTRPSRLRLVRGIVVGGVALGVGFFGVDLREACASRAAAKQALRLVRAGHPDGAVWCFGPWGFEYYAEQAGLKPAGVSIRPGDWLVEGDHRFTTWPGATSFLERVAEGSVEDCIPVRTMMCYYGGRTALEHHAGPRFRFTIYRVLPWPGSE